MMYCALQKTYKSGKRSFFIDIKASFHLHKINVIYGVSGAGKTSLLRLLSGLDLADEGIIKVNNNYWLNTNEKLNISVAKRNIAYVFQEVGLFPNMTVLQNIQFAKKNIPKNVLKEVLNTLEITELSNQKPTELSGGQQQRVALARAIVQEPDFLFLDEPLTAIDESLRNKLQNYLITLQQKYKFTVVMISHHLPEVLKIASHVCVINNGKVIQQGTPSLLISTNKQNTLKGIVLSLTNDIATIIVGNQQIVIPKKHITTPKFTLNSEIEFSVSLSLNC